MLYPARRIKIIARRFLGTETKVKSLSGVEGT
jgi:hypothetical protein